MFYENAGSACRLTGDQLLFIWLSLVMSMMVSFCAVLFPTRCLLDEILDLIESVSGGGGGREGRGRVLPTLL